MTERRRDAARETVDQVRRALEPRASSDQATARPAAPAPHASTDFASLPEYELLKISKAFSNLTGMENPFYLLHDGRAGETTSIGGRAIVNFSSYDYLGLNGHPEVVARAKAAIDAYGTTVSASRLSAGERQVHRDLEAALARLHGTEDAVAFVSGHATNMTVIGTLMGPEDLIVADAYIHNSVNEGARLSGARRVLCPHGDLEAYERALKLNRGRCRRALIVVEGLYSMDGDMPDLAALVRLKRRYNAWLMVDEAHATGALGATGRGIAEEQGVDPADVDIWMGTLSKSLAATGGYIAGNRALTYLIRYTTPGFVFSVGLAPPLAAAATAAIEIMAREPWRAAALRTNGTAMLEGARKRGLDTGFSIGASVVPVIVGNSLHAVALSTRLLARGYNVSPAVFPGVAENQARLRFFMTARHTPEQIEGVLDAVAEELPRARITPTVADIVGDRGGGTG